MLGLRTCHQADRAESAKVWAIVLLTLTAAIAPANGSELHEAVRTCDIPQVKVLIASGNTLNEQDADGNTPLQEAIRAGKPHCVYLLLEAGANRYLFNRAHENAHSLARFHSDPVSRDQMLPLLENLNLIRPGTDSKQWSLQYAALRGQADLASLVLDLGADPNAAGPDGNTPLHNASLKGYIPVVNALLQHGASISVRDSNGYSPLHDAALGGHVAVARVLLAAGADLSMANNDSRESPLHVAASWGRLEVVRLLLDAGASRSAKDGKGRTPLDLAVENNHSEVAAILRTGTP